MIFLASWEADTHTEKTMAGQYRAEDLGGPYSRLPWKYISINELGANSLH